MRAREFIFEKKMISKGEMQGHTYSDGSHTKDKQGELRPEEKKTMGKVHRFAAGADRVYDLNRTMMAVASSDGKEMSHEPDETSWIGRANMAAPYTEEENEMLHHAYKHLNMPVQQAIDTYHEEPDDTNTDCAVPSAPEWSKVGEKELKEKNKKADSQ